MKTFLSAIFWALLFVFATIGILNIIEVAIKIKVDAAVSHAREGMYTAAQLEDARKSMMFTGRQACQCPKVKK